MSAVREAERAAAGRHGSNANAVSSFSSLGQVQPTWELAPLCAGVSEAIGFAAGITPAIQAARLEIVTALRGG